MWRSVRCRRLVTQTVEAVTLEAVLSTLAGTRPN